MTNTLSQAVAALGAVEVAPGFYAFSDGWNPQASDGRQYWSVSASDLERLQKRAPGQTYSVWRHKYAKQLPPWWTPEQRETFVVRCGEQRLLAQRYETARAIAKMNRGKGHIIISRITADLGTGEEVLA